MLFLPIFRFLFSASRSVVMAARVIVGVVMVPAFGYIAVCTASPAAWVAADLFLFPAYAWAMRRLAAAREADAKKAPAMPGKCAGALAAR